MSFATCIPLSILLLALVYVPVGLHAVRTWRLFRNRTNAGKTWQLIILQSALIALWWTLVFPVTMAMLILSQYNFERPVQDYSNVVLLIAFFPDLILTHLGLFSGEFVDYLILYWTTAMVILLLIPALMLIVQRARSRKQAPEPG